MPKPNMILFLVSIEIRSSTDESGTDKHFYPEC